MTLACGLFCLHTRDTWECIISSEETIIKIINEVIEENPLEVDKYKAGKKKLKGFINDSVYKV